MASKTTSALIFSLLALIAACRDSSTHLSESSNDDSMTPGILTIEHIEFGQEQFAVDSALYNLYQSEDGIWELVVKVTTGSAILRSKVLEEEIDAHPLFEATSIMDAADLDLKRDDVIVQEQGYDYERDQHLSNIYYFRHESIEDLRLELHEVTVSGFEATLTGQAIINGSSGNTCDSRLSMRAIFLKDETLRRGIQ